jgi:hypothetical protein
MQRRFVQILQSADHVADGASESEHRMGPELRRFWGLVERGRADRECDSGRVIDLASYRNARLGARSS